MAVAALGTIAVAALPNDSALGLIGVVGGFVAAAFAFGIFGVTRTGAGWQMLRVRSAPPGESVAASLQVRGDSA
jgi:hypothetical protein